MPQAILGHADIKMTLRYAHRAPDYLRAEMATTGRKAPAVSSTQESTHEVVSLAGVAGAEGGI